MIDRIVSEKFGMPMPGVLIFFLKLARGSHVQLTSPVSRHTNHTPYHNSISAHVIDHVTDIMSPLFLSGPVCVSCSLLSDQVRLSVRQVVLSEQMMMMMADIGSQREYTILSEDLNLCFHF